MPSAIKKALILVAGLGSRLDPLTQMLPKCMVEVNGTPILINTLNHLAANGFKQVVIVTGYMDFLITSQIGNQFKNMEIIYIKNEIFYKTNNMYSLWLAKEYLIDDNGVLLIEGDLFFEEAVLTRLLNTGDNSYWVVDKFILFKEGCMLTTDEAGGIEKIDIIRHTLSRYKRNQHKSAGMVKISNQMGQILSDCLDFEVKHGHFDIYYDQVVSRHIKQFDLNTCDINGLKWVEIDNIHDLKKAEAIF
ncbi:MAG: phosphocholine cytidylyltransferase family protein [Desulfobacula sp.]|nr:phosphocholine cytidylyltransferase family protein [Desulfobacula sp.]